MKKELLIRGLLLSLLLGSSVPLTIAGAAESAANRLRGILIPGCS